MKRYFFLLLTLTVGLSSALANPRVLKAPLDAISYARDGKKPLILFALIGSEEGSRNFAKLLNDNKLKMESNEFVIALCDASDKRNAGLFTGKFAQKIDSLPTVVITDATGKPMAPSLNGVQQQDDYDRMIHAALLEAGLREKNAPIISSTTGKVLEGSSDVFRIMEDDVNVGPKVITAYRDWTLKDGTTFNGAVLVAEGAEGTFLLEDGSEKRVNFNTLSAKDVTYLQGALK